MGCRYKLLLQWSRIRRTNLRPRERSRSLRLSPYGCRRRRRCAANTFETTAPSAASLVELLAPAKHDTTNTVVAGCVTGGALSAKAGPQAACVGCAGFAAFSVLIEKFLDRHD